MLNAASRESLAAVRDEVAVSAGTTSDRPGVAEALFAISGLLAGNPGLRRNLAEGSVDPEKRSGLLTRLLQGKVPDAAADLAGRVVARRWSTPWDLVDAVEDAGYGLLLAEAEANGTLDTVEDQLFRFSRIVGGDSGLRGALDDRAVDPERRAALARTLLDGKAEPVTAALVAQSVRSTANPSTELALDDLLELTAARRNQSVASVTSAVPLSDAQVDRLAAGLSRVYGRTVTVRVDVDPHIRGGLVVRLGDEIIDGSVATRLAAARAGLRG